MADAQLRYAFYADDFTGATDTLATLAGAGLRALLFLGVPGERERAAAGPLDALGVAGAARSLAPQALCEELAPLVEFFASLPAPLLHYKCCSTFDSSAEAGNLALAASLLRPLAQDRLVPIVGGQPSLGRYCAFGQLFAAAGEGGEVLRIDRHPTMSVHPVTPMHEADLRLHLAAQGWQRLGLVDWRALDGGDAALDAALHAALAGGDGGVLFDVLSQPHLHSIGRLLWRRAHSSRLLAMGASSVAQAVCAHWNAEGDFAVRAPGVPPAARGPVLLLVGSLSPVTARQMHEGGARYESIELDPASLLGDGHALDLWAGACAARLNAGRHVMVHTPRASTGQPPAREVARLCGRVLARVLALAPAVRRVGVAGGDSASHAVRALGPWGLEHLGCLAPGVPLVRARASEARLDGLELMLKGGQMGPPDLFDRLLG